jgi:uncharacterized protein (DUF169 family)
MKNKPASDLLCRYLKLSTPPVALRMCASKAGLPPKVKIPRKDWGLDFRACQAVHVARRYEIAVAVPKDEMPCPTGAVALGFYKPNAVYYSGLYLSPMEMSQQAKKVRAKNTPKLKAGKYSYLLAAPLDQAAFQPDVILIYGNPGQISRLVQAAVLKTGKALSAQTTVATACAEWVSAAMNTGQCQYVFPCDGERKYGALDDSEMVFSIPYQKMEEILSALKIANESREIRKYPVERFLIHQAPMSERYTKLLASLRSEAGSAKSSPRAKNRGSRDS